MKKLSPAALDVIGRIRVEPKPGDGVIAFLPPVQLDRKLYQEVNKVLETLGGSWNRKLKGHLFLSDGDLEDALDTVVHTGGFVDRKKLLQFYETPPLIAERLVDLTEIDDDMRVLEPSAGHGRIVDALLPVCGQTTLTLCEIDPEKAHKLRTKYGENPKICVINEIDFLKYDSNPSGSLRFDRVAMNPPFTKQQDAKHVRHAWSLLAPGGILVAVMSAAVRFRETDLYRWVRDNAETIEDNDPGAFKESGTMVNTVIVRMRRGE
jgi:predicted RNA methylase